MLFIENSTKVVTNPDDMLIWSLFIVKYCSRECCAQKHSIKSYYKLTSHCKNKAVKKLKYFIILWIFRVMASHVYSRIASFALFSRVVIVDCNPINF